MGAAGVLREHGRSETPSMGAQGRGGGLHPGEAKSQNHGKEAESVCSPSHNLCIHKRTSGKCAGLGLLNMNKTAGWTDELNVAWEP